MKILFVLSHALYLRNFQSVIRDLVRRGHQVELSFTAARHGAADDLADALGPEHASVGVQPAPPRSGWWWPAADPLRALRDAVHYRQPALAMAVKARARAERRVPRPARPVIGAIAATKPGRRLIEAILDRVERSIPADRSFDEWLAAHRPDAVVISPLIDLDYVQTDILKTAVRAGIPTAQLVASWDNLTNKGRIQIQADRVVVWNEAQRAEALAIHDVEDRRLVVTGAQLYDQWFEMRPSAGRTAFCAGLGGLEPASPIILYAGSSPFICPDETGFFRRWLTLLRDAGEADLQRASIVIRPHPLHADQWRAIDAEGLPGVRVWPGAGEMPIGEAASRAYFDSLWHAAAVVGVNTSVFLEAAIVGRPNLTLLDPAYAETQRGMLHFSHLLERELIHATPDPREHVAALAAALRHPPAEDAPGTRFPTVVDFVRPQSIDRPSTPLVADVIESLAHVAPGGYRPPWYAAAVRALLWPAAALYFRPRYMAALARRDSSAATARGRTGDDRSG